MTIIGDFHYDHSQNIKKNVKRESFRFFFKKAETSKAESYWLYLETIHSHFMLYDVEYYQYLKISLLLPFASHSIILYYIFFFVLFSASSPRDKKKYKVEKDSTFQQKKRLFWLLELQNLSSENSYYRLVSITWYAVAKKSSRFALFFAKQDEHSERAQIINYHFFVVTVAFNLNSLRLVVICLHSIAHNKRIYMRMRLLITVKESE